MTETIKTLLYKNGWSVNHTKKATNLFNW